MQVSVMVRGYSTETLRAFLGIASDMGLPISVVRTTPLGLIIPVELASKAGILPTEEPEQPKTKRTRTKVKTGFNTEPPQTETLWEE